MTLGRHDEAIGCFEKAIELDPDYAVAHHDKGLSLAALGLYDKAIGCFEKAIELDPDYAVAHNNKKLLLEALRPHDQQRRRSDARFDAQ